MPTRYYVDTQGRYLGGFDGASPPAAAREVPEAPDHAADRWDGALWRPDLDGLKARATAEVDAAAETRRLAVLTPGAGQMLVYQEVWRQAAEYAALHAPPAAPAPAGKYPLLEAQIGPVVPDTGDPAADLAAAAAAVAALAAVWIGYAAAIERTRLAAKRAIAGATVARAVTTVLAGLAWPAPPGGPGA
jgi:hypothetical protein